jgi:hypothetical protein
MAQSASADAEGARTSWRECLKLLEALSAPAPSDQALMELLRKAIETKSVP